MTKIAKRYHLDPPQVEKVKRRASSLSKKEHRKVTESEIIRRLIEKGLTTKGEFIGTVTEK